MKGIVVGLDESAPAAVSLRWAIRESQLHDWPVTAVLAWDYLGQHHGAAPPSFDPDYNQLAAAKALNEFINQTAGAAANTIGRAAILDHPGPALVEASIGAQLLVVGARGLGGFRDLLLGSVSRYCLHHATCPVAVIRGTERSPADSSDRIVVGVDGSETSQRALAWAARESTVRQTPLTIVHTYSLAYLHEFEYAAPALHPDMLEQAAHQTVDRALAGIDTTGLPAAAERVVANTGAAAAILDAAGDASLVVIGSRGMGDIKGFVLGSVSHQVTHHAPCPVVVIPPADRSPSTEPSPTV
jgi:nucleotide-binding universal stress UspA family protein